jgi:hypothetical protein
LCRYAEVPPPKTPAPFTPSPPAGAPMERPTAPGLHTRVITPKPGRTLKCLYAAAVGAGVVTPEWVHASLDAGRALSPASTPPAMLLSRGGGGPRAGARAGAGAGAGAGETSRRGGDVDGDGDDDDGSPITTGSCGGLFNGVVAALSGDSKFSREFGILLRHAGAEVVSADVGLYSC